MHDGPAQRFNSLTCTVLRAMTAQPIDAKKQTSKSVLIVSNDQTQPNLFQNSTIIRLVTVGFQRKQAPRTGVS